MPGNTYIHIAYLDVDIFNPLNFNLLNFHWVKKIKPKADFLGHQWVFRK